jgi:peptide-methionine (S)-S-oxide reductase
MNTKNIQLATFGGGCFWCTEAVFQEVKGIEKVESGYSGGDNLKQPTYREVCSGVSGYAEVVQITFNANIISYKELVIIFMTTHDPTSLNKQGAGRGTQYRSVIYYNNKRQKEIADAVLKEMTPYYDKPIVTEVSPLGVFYIAEKEHQDYYKNNPTSGYCSFVITPKLTKLRKLHRNKLRT